MVFLAFAENAIQLVPDGTIFLHIALILVMIWFLNRTLFKPINRILQERDKQTVGGTGEAKGILQQADAKLAHYERALREARAAGYSTIEQTRALALSNRENQIEIVKAEVAEMVAREKAALENQVQGARTELQINARDLATRISTNILKQTA